MKIRIPAEPRTTSWRDRFLEIARQVEAGHQPRAMAQARSRQRPRISAMATRRVRVLQATG